MIFKNLKTILPALAVVFMLVLSVFSISSFALIIYPIDYTYTGFAQPNSTVKIDIVSSTPSTTTFTGIAGANSQYSIPAQLATKTGKFIVSFTDVKGVATTTTIDYDMQAAAINNATGDIIIPNYYTGSGETPDANIKVLFPDGSSIVTKADSAGNYTAFSLSIQKKGEVQTVAVDGVGLEIGTAKKGNYDGNVVTVNVTKAEEAKKAVVKTIPPSASTATPATPATPVASSNPAVTVKPATVRTGGSVESSIIFVVIAMVIGFFVLNSKKLSKK
jgi:hypothetical protein